MADNFLSSKEFEILRSNGHMRECGKGEYVVSEGDSADSIYLVISGSLAVLTEDEEGNELCANILGPGDFFGEMGLCTENWVRSASVQARQKSIVLRMQYSTYLRLSTEHNQLMLKIIHQLSSKLNEITTRARQFVHMSAPERVLYMLRDLSRMAGVEKTDQGPLVAVTKKEIGNMAGCSRETASRALQELESAGAIVNQGRKVLIICEAG